MKQLLIAQNVAYAASKSGGTAANASELALGALGVFLATGELLTAANVAASVADKKTFYIAVGTADSISRTPDIQRDGIVDFRVAEYAAPVKQQSTVTLTNAKFVDKDNVAVATADYRHRGQEAIIRVVDTMPANIAPNIQSYSTAVVTGDTPTTVATRLASEINKTYDSKVTATSAAGVVTITDKRVGGHFRLAVDGIILNGGTIEQPTVPFYPGSGTPEMLAEMDRLSLAFHHGVHSQAGGRGELSVPLSIAAGGQYDLYFLDIVNRHYAKHGMDATFGRGLEFCIAIPDGGTALEGALGALFPVLFNSQGTARDTEPAVDTAADA